MVCSSWTPRGTELLGQRGGLEKYRRSGSTFGIPLLHPWANRLDRRIDSPLVRRDAGGLPIHGILAASPHWRVVREDPLTARLDFGAVPDYMAVFPHAHVIEVEVRRAEHSQTITTRVTATGDDPVPIAFGWHPYLQLPGAAREEWELTLPVTERLVADDRGIPTGATEAVDYPPGLRLADRAFDDGYAGVADGATFRLAAGDAAVELEFERGYAYAQVYAPPGEALVAFEPMTAPTNALVSGDGLRTVDPGDAFEAVFTLRALG